LGLVANIGGGLIHALLVIALLLSACTPIAPGIAPAPTGSATVSEAANPTTDGEEITLYVSSEKVKCVGVAPMECLQVKYSQDGESELFYTGIDGFVFVPGYNYELRMLRTKVANPPADGSSLAYTLLEVVRQEPTYRGNPLPLEGTHWTLIAFGTEDMVAFSPAAQTVDTQFMNRRMAGLNGCNNYSADYIVVGDKIQLGLAISTKMACPEPAMAVEHAFMAALASTSIFAIDGNLLTITYAAGQLTFRGAEPTAADLGSIATIVLPDGSQCQFAGPGATLAFDDKRLNYTCSAAETLPFTGLLGEITQDGAGTLTLDFATVNRDDSGFVLDDAQMMTLLAARLLLADGSQCEFAGMGATLAFDGERLNYTCGDPSVGLLGPLVQSEAGEWTASRVTLERKDGNFVIADREEVVISEIQSAEMP
jgi:heat shock protein HslJ